MRRGDLDGLGHVLAFQYVEPQQRAFGVQERSLGHLQLVLPDPDRYRFDVGGEGVAGDSCPLPSIVVTHCSTSSPAGVDGAWTGTLSWQTSMRNSMTLSPGKIVAALGL